MSASECCLIGVGVDGAVSRSLRGTPLLGVSLAWLRGCRVVLGLRAALRLGRPGAGAGLVVVVVDRTLALRANCCSCLEGATLLLAAAAVVGGAALLDGSSRLLLLLLRLLVGYLGDSLLVIVVIIAKCRS